MSLTANRDLYNQVSGIGSSFVDNYMRGTQTRIAKEQEKRDKRKEALSYIKTTLDKGSEIGFLNEAAGNAYFRDKIANDPLLQEYQARLGIKNLNLYFDREKGGGIYSEQVPLQNVKKGLAKQWGVSLEDANDIFKKKGLSDNSLVSLERTKSGIGINLDTGVKEGASFESVQSLRKEYSNNVTVKEGRKINSAVSRMDSVWSNYQKDSNIQSRNALDQALVITFNKMMDPGSVVRESEYARTPQGQAFVSQLQGYADKIAKGGVGLTDPERAEIVRISKLLKQGHDNEVQKINRNYIKESKLLGIDPSRIIGEYYSEEQGTSSQSVVFLESNLQELSDEDLLRELNK